MTTSHSIKLKCKALARGPWTKLNIQALIEWLGHNHEFAESGWPGGSANLFSGDVRKS
jgi:hypothetical protein